MYVKLYYVEVLYFYYIIELTLMCVCMQHVSIQKVTTVCMQMYAVYLLVTNSLNMHNHHVLISFLNQTMKLVVKLALSCIFLYSQYDFKLTVSKIILIVRNVQRGKWLHNALNNMLL